MPDSEAKIKIFVSYAHEDDAERQDLTDHLRLIPNVSVWDDRAIPAGSSWDDEIAEQLESADIILLLISGPFLLSEYVQKVEIKEALQRRATGSAVVIPVLLKECIWSPHLGDIQALPSDENKPEDKNWVTSGAWSSLNEAYTHVARGVMREVEKLSERREQLEQRQGEAEETYRKKVAKMLADNVISDIERDTLDELRAALELSQEHADRIEKGELRPIEERQTNLVRYEKTLRREILRGYPFSDNVEADLAKRREDLLLSAADVASLQRQIVEEWESGETQRLETQRLETERLAAEGLEVERLEAEHLESEQNAEEDKRRLEEERLKAERDATEEAEQAAADAWHVSLSSFLAEQLEDEDDVFRMQPEIPKRVLKASLKLYEVPKSETIVGMLADFADEPEFLGILFGRQGVYFNNPSGSAPGAQASLYSSFPSSDFSINDDSEVHLEDDVFLLTPAPVAVAQLFGSLGDLAEDQQAALDGRSEPLTADEAEGFAQGVFDGWKAKQEARQQAEEVWGEELMEFLRDHGRDHNGLIGTLFVAPDISDRKASSAWERYGLPPDEFLLGLLDETAMGSAKYGLAFGVRGMYFHNAGGSRSPGTHFVEYSSFPTREVELTAKYEVDLDDKLSYNSLRAGDAAELLASLQVLIEGSAS